MKPILPLATLLVLALGHAAPAAAQVPTRACSFSRENPIPENSTWADQFRCYQSSGRRVTFEASVLPSQTLSGGSCVRGVGVDRVQIGACGGFNGDASITISFSAIASVIDNPDRPDVVIRLDR